MPPFYPIFACVDPPGSRKLLNIDPIRIRIHNTDFKVYTIHCAVQYTDVYVHLGKQILKKEFFFCPRSILHNGGPVSPLLGFYIILTSCTIGWVNLYHKFEIEKYTVCGKLILPKKRKAFFKFFCTTDLRICMDLQIFASFLYPTLLMICSQKFDRK